MDLGKREIGILSRFFRSDEKLQLTDKWQAKTFLARV